MKEKIEKLPRSKCYRCQWYQDGDQGNVCKVQGWGYFDVEAARKIIGRTGRRTVLYDAKTLRKVISENSSIFEPHLLHVNVRKPGILARYKPPDGPAETFLLEGRHRAVRQMFDGKALKLYELTEEETQMIFLGKRVPGGKRFISKQGNRRHRHGRKNPYTSIGIARLPCARCGAKPSLHQWNLCSDNNLQRPVCEKCDAEMNALVLMWMADPEAAAKFLAYCSRESIPIDTAAVLEAAKAANEAFIKVRPRKWDWRKGKKNGKSGRPNRRAGGKRA